MKDTKPPEDAICDWCKLRTATIYDSDPFLSEVYPEEGPYPDELWCDECHDERAMDV
jgi:hypothetical protein